MSVPWESSVRMTTVTDRAVAGRGIDVEEPSRRAEAMEPEHAEVDE